MKHEKFYTASAPITQQAEATFVKTERMANHSWTPSFG
jgi:hypothetical protein